MVKFVNIIRSLIIQRANFLGIVLIFLSLSACVDSSIKMNDIKQSNFLVRYMTQNRQLYAEAVFKTDSTFRFEHEVLLDEDPMLAKRLPVVGWQYRITNDRVNFKNAYSFLIPTNKGEGDESLQVDLSLPTMTNIRMKDQQLSKEKGGALVWDGSPSEEGIGLYLLLTDSIGNTIQTNHIGQSKGNSVPIFPMNLQSLSIGTGQVTIFIRKIEQIAEPFPHTTTIEYYLPIQNVMINP